MGRTFWAAAVIAMCCTFLQAEEPSTTTASDKGDSTATQAEISASQTPSGDNTLDDGTAILLPRTLRVKQGEPAVFIYDAKDDASKILSDYQGNKKGYTYSFDTADMEPAKYTITLKVTDVTLQQTRAASAVLFVDSASVHTVTVPKLVGEEKQKVLKMIAKAGLHAGKIEERVSAKKAGIVLEQKPEPDVVVDAGSAVDLVVAKSEPSTRLTAKIEPMTVHVKAGEPARFWSKSVYGTKNPVSKTWHGPRGTGEGDTFSVDTTGLEAGSYMISLEVTDQMRHQGDTAMATLYVEAEPVETVVVPQLVGQDRQTVLEMIEQAGLRVGNIEERVSDEKPGTVLEQYPAPGTALAAGNTVDLVIAKAAEGSKLELSATVVNKDVTLRATVAPEQGKAEYRFDFGDGYKTGWQEWGESLHRYAALGDYTAIAEARIGDKYFIANQLVEIRPVAYTLELTADQSDEQNDGAVTVHAKLDPAGEEVRYRFDFGDGSEVVERSAAVAMHTYGSGGMYRISVVAAVDGEEVSDHISVTLPNRGMSPIFYASLGLLVLTTLGWSYFYVRQSRKEEDDEGDVTL